MAAATTTSAELDSKYDVYDFPVVAPVKQDGHPGHLTPEQIEKVKQLRTSLESKGYTDRLDTFTLVRCSRQALKADDILGWHTANTDVHSCASCVRASSTSLLPRRCMICPNIKTQFEYAAPIA